MLEKMWEKRNSYTLLVGIQIDVATIENSIEVSLKKDKLKIELP